MTREFLLPNRCAFLRSLDLTRKELEPVRAALDKGNVAHASEAYAQHFRTRVLSQILSPDWSNTPCDPQYVNQRSENCLQGLIQGDYDTYRVPEDGIDWHNGPLTTITRFPLFPDLLLSAHHSGDLMYAQYIVKHSLEYMHAWPLKEFVGTDTYTWPKDVYSVFPAWWWVMLPNRIDRWSECVAWIRHSSAASDEDLICILERMYQETRYLEPFIQREVMGGHNVGAAMVKALTVSALVLDDFQIASAWLSHAAELALEYVDRAYYPDGLFKELSTSYSLTATISLLTCAAAFRELPAFREIEDRLRSIITATCAQRKPDGYMPAFGDLYLAKPLSEYLRKPLEDQGGLPWAAGMLDAREPPPNFTHWPIEGSEVYGGYYVMRSDWGAKGNQMIIDAGPWGTNHQHCDRLSFVLTALGVDFITDPCCTRYHSTDADADLSQMYAGFLHNTITVDGVDTYMPDRSFMTTAQPLDNTWEHGNNYVLFVGKHSFDPVKPVCWERRVLFVDNKYWILQDVLTGAPEEIEVEQNFQFTENTAVAFEGDMVVATAVTNERLLLRPLGSSLSPELLIGDPSPHVTYSSTYDPNTEAQTFPHGRGWVARFTKHKFAAPAVTYSGKVRLPASVTVALIPLSGDQAPSEYPEIAFRKSDARTTLELQTGRGTLRFETSADGCRVVEYG